MLLRTGRIDSKYKNKTSKENEGWVGGLHLAGGGGTYKIITLYLNIWTQKTSVNKLMGNISHYMTNKILATYSDEHSCGCERYIFLFDRCQG